MNLYLEMSTYAKHMLYHTTMALVTYIIFEATHMHHLTLLSLGIVALDMLAILGSVQMVGNMREMPAAGKEMEGRNAGKYMQQPEQ